MSDDETQRCEDADSSKSTRLQLAREFATMATHSTPSRRLKVITIFFTCLRFTSARQRLETTTTTFKLNSSSCTHLSVVSAPVARSLATAIMV